MTCFNIASIESQHSISPHETSGERKYGSFNAYRFTRDPEAVTCDPCKVSPARLYYLEKQNEQKSKRRRSKRA